MNHEFSEKYEEIDRHVRAGDYFGTAATVLDLALQDLSSRRRRGRRLSELLPEAIAALQRTRRYSGHAEVAAPEPRHATPDAISERHPCCYLADASESKG